MRLRRSPASSAGLHPACPGRGAGRRATAARFLGSLGLVAILGTLLAGCVPPPPPVGLSDVIARPAERQLLAGMRAYDDGNYGDAERALKAALGAGLASPHDQAAAHKLLAFIECTSNRIGECEASFRAARRADPGFALSHSEAGHPVWGPVYQKVAAAH